METARTHDGITVALLTGCRVHAFLSGGGLRVVRIELNGDLKGYGEHPHVEVAMAHANKDFIAGGREYSDVYGVGKQEEHYLTGSSVPVSQLDEWLLQGRTFDIWQEGDEVVFQLKGLNQTTTPKKVINRIMERAKLGLYASRRWESRGYTYLSESMLFPSGDPGVSTRVEKAPPGRSGSDPWMYHITKTGRGANYAEALAKALEAPEVEVEK